MITFCILSTVLFLPDLSLHSGLCCHKSFCLSVCLSVTLVHPTQGVEISGNVSTPSCTLDIRDLHAKFDGDRPRGSRTSAVKRKRGIEK